MTLRPTKSVQTIYELLEQAIVLHADQPAYYERIQDQWRKTTWSELKKQVDEFALALLSQGFQAGDTVSILSANRLLWPIADLGTIAAGGISVGLYPTSSPDQCAYILRHAESKFVVVDTPQQQHKLLQVRSQLPALQAMIGKEVAEKQEGILPWDDFLRLGQSYREQGHWESYQEIAHRARSADTAVIVYTSGTTGQPKGACLSHRYVLASCEALEQIFVAVRDSLPPERVPTAEPFVTLSFLPFCHVAERISGMYSRLYSGFTAYLIDDPTKIFQYLKELSPHVFGGLPRFYEKIYARIKNEISASDSQEAFQRAREIHRQVKAHEFQGNPLPESLREQWAWAEEHVYQKVRAHFGPRILACSSGAAPIPKDILEFFESAGNLTILEAYGLTEFVCCAFNTPRAHKANSVGKPMYGCEIRLAEDGEILLHGPQMFSGYFKDEEATREMIDPQGWLHTGDIGRLDEDGFLFITGRKKEFLKTSTGKKIAPLAIENLCKRNHLVSQVMVYGDNKSYLTALITLNSIELLAFAQTHPALQDEHDYRTLTQHPMIQQGIEATIHEVNRQFSSTEQIKRYRILERDFSIEANEITPTGKVKRKVVSEVFRKEIEAMYE